MKKIILTIAIIPSVAFADLPLTVENIISEQGKTTLELGLIYGNNKINEFNVGGYIPVQISDSSFINVPTAITNEKVQNDFILASIGAKHGILKNLDISTRANVIYNSTRYLDVNTSNTSTSNTDIADISLGLNYQFLQDEKHPALVGFIEATAFEKGDYKNNYFSGVTIGATTYRSYDPIVLSLTTGYKYNSKRDVDKDLEYKPSDLFFFNPQVAFAANDKISLIAGLNFRFLSSQKANNQVIVKNTNNIDYNLGVGYGISDRSSLNFDIFSLNDPHSNFKGILI